MSILLSSNKQKVRKTILTFIKKLEWDVKNRILFEPNEQLFDARYTSFSVSFATAIIIICWISL